MKKKGFFDSLRGFLGMECACDECECPAPKKAGKRKAKKKAKKKR